MSFIYINIIPSKFKYEINSLQLKAISVSYNKTQTLFINSKNYISFIQ